MKCPPIRALAESVFAGNNASGSVRVISASEAYDLACTQGHVAVTDLPMHPGSIQRLGLAADAKVVNDNHGDVVGRSAEARIFYREAPKPEKDAIEAMLREAVYEMQVTNDLIVGEAVVGTHPDMMFKARLVCPESDASNVFNWLANYTPLAAVPEYEQSKLHNIPDILFVAYPDWQPDHEYLERLYPKWYADQLFHRWFRGCVVVDEKDKTIFNLGLRYFGERKKGHADHGLDRGHGPGRGGGPRQHQGNRLQRNQEVQEARQTGHLLLRPVRLRQVLPRQLP